VQVRARLSPLGFSDSVMIMTEELKTFYCDRVRKMPLSGSRCAYWVFVS